ncbi:MAG: 6-phosphogluconolactonase [Oleibacter sp.]|nr:6-phosphogluconolactonase [Thalassolituus sp.]
MIEHRFSSSAILANQLADDLADRMRDAIEQRGRVCIAVSGGKTPEQFLQSLSKQKLDWSKVVVTLVDERWVDESSADSNAALVKKNLLQGEASKAYFLALKNPAGDPISGFMACENTLHEQIRRLDFAVFGMGDDGHTASWFPNSSALLKCLDAESSAWCCPVNDAPNGIPRMTLTWRLLGNCRHSYLHFEGPNKLEVFKQASAPDALLDVQSMPVRQLLQQTQVPLSIFRSE